MRSADIVLGDLVELEAFELVLLRRAPSANDDATLERIQRQRLAFLERMRVEGFALAPGPVADQPDETLRDCASMTRARSSGLANSPRRISPPLVVGSSTS